MLNHGAALMVAVGQSKVAPTQHLVSGRYIGVRDKNMTSTPQLAPPALPVRVSGTPLGLTALERPFQLPAPDCLLFFECTGTFYSDTHLRHLHYVVNKNTSLRLKVSFDVS